MVVPLKWIWCELAEIGLGDDAAAKEHPFQQSVPQQQRVVSAPMWAAITAISTREMT
jgi:hypothetical protein